MAAKLLLLFAFTAALSFADCRPTHCERWKGDKEFRCGKDNYKADVVTIRNRLDETVSFNVGKWMSRCGRNGVNYANEKYTMHAGGVINAHFSEAGPGACNEMFIHNCKIGNHNANCIDAVHVTSNL